MLTIDPTERLANRLARLNATTVKFDIGAGGGAPGLTAQDIAAALGMVTGGLGRELVMHVYWPDGATRTRQSLLNDMRALQLAEYNRREALMASALCRLATCEPYELDRARRLYAKANGERWPLWVTKLEPMTLAKGYGRIRVGVLEELASPRRCSECGGRELTDRKGAPRVCERCLGRGTVDYGASWRAEKMEMKHSSFVQRWAGPYQWLLDQARAELQQAEAALTRVLRS